MPYTPLHTSAAQDQVLSKSIEVLRPGTVAIIDLDGVLFDTRARQVRIIQMFFEHTDDAAFAGITKEHFYDWSLTTTLKNSGLEPKTAAAKSAELRPFWEQHFFSPEAVLWDDALPGAAEWVTSHARGR